MGLARAFFEAGSRAVVGSLWPLRDDETAAPSPWSLPAGAAVLAASVAALALGLRREGR